MSKEFYGFEKLSLVDYNEKLSCTLFTGGCNFRCQFCHNSEIVLNYNEYESFDFENILEYLKVRKGILEGVCISGGEPTLMPNLEERLRQIKELGYDIKLDTNGTNPMIIKNLYEKGLIDYVAMDIKNSLEKYDLTTGIKDINLNPIKESINYLLTSGIDYEFRTTLIEEFHEEKDIIEIGKMIKGAKRYFLQHFENKGGNIQDGLNEVVKEKALVYKNLLNNYIKEVNLRGY